MKKLMLKDTEKVIEMINNKELRVFELESNTNVRRFALNKKNLNEGIADMKIENNKLFLWNGKDFVKPTTEYFIL